MDNKKGGITLSYIKINIRPLCTVTTVQKRWAKNLKNRTNLLGFLPKNGGWAAFHLSRVSLIKRSIAGVQ